MANEQDAFGRLPQPASEKTIYDAETLKIFSDAMRRRIMRVISTTPQTVPEIAEQLNVPFTRLYYHIKMLERHELIQVVETRMLSGAVEEKYYQVTARTFNVDRRLLTMFYNDVEHEQIENAVDEMLDQARRDIHQGIDAGTIRIQAEPPDTDSLLLKLVHLKLSKDGARDFYEQFIELMGAFATSEQPDADGKNYALVLAFHPIEEPDDLA